MSTGTTSSAQKSTSVAVLTPPASSGSQSVQVSSQQTQSDSSDSTSCNIILPPASENLPTQLDDYLIQDKSDDGTLYGRISDDSSSPSLSVIDLDAAYKARAHDKIETFNTDFQPPKK
ncbi:hypothetical protein QBC39DRAFT_431589 [Podospora conica]|nr:hypothetical protein QBC39DRAFT_431589 [Schizothecium conicum]